MSKVASSTLAVTVPTILAALAVSVSLAGAATGVWRQIGRQAAAGEYAIAAAHGDATRPRQIAVNVLAVPNQRTSGTWTLSCSKGFGIGSRSGKFAGRTPFLLPLRLPMANPSACSVIASASIMAGGRLTVRLLAR